VSNPSPSPIESPSNGKASRVPAAVGLLADVAGVVAFLLAGVKVIALVLGAVAILLGIYLIVARWGKPFRLASLGAVVILSIGTSIVGGVVGHQLSQNGATPAFGGVGGVSSPHAGTSAPGAGAGATESPSASMGGTDPSTDASPRSASPSTSLSPDLNSSSTPANLGDPRQNLLTNANGFGTATGVTINAKTFTYGLSGCRIPCGSATSDFNLGRVYSTLTGRLGVLDSSRTGGSAHIQVIADGNVIASKTVQLGVSYDISVSVKNVLRLQFVESNDGGVVAAVGDPTVTP
jgi:hypothetical protein